MRAYEPTREMQNASDLDENGDAKRRARTVSKFGPKRPPLSMRLRTIEVIPGYVRQHSGPAKFLADRSCAFAYRRIAPSYKDPPVAQPSKRIACTIGNHMRTKLRWWVFLSSQADITHMDEIMSFCISFSMSRICVVWYCRSLPAKFGDGS